MGIEIAFGLRGCHLLSSKKLSRQDGCHQFYCGGRVGTYAGQYCSLMRFAPTGPADAWPRLGGGGPRRSHAWDGARCRLSGCPRDHWGRVLLEFRGCPLQDFRQRVTVCRVLKLPPAPSENLDHGQQLLLRRSARSGCTVLLHNSKFHFSVQPRQQ